MRNINLLPAAHRPQPKFELKRFIPLLMGTIIVLSLITAFIVLQITISSTRGVIAAKNNNIEILEVKLDTMSELETIDRLIRKIDQIESASISHIGILDDIESFMPGDMTLTGLSINDAGISIQGQASELKSISAFMNSLNQWEGFHEVDISHISTSGNKLTFNIEVANGGEEE